MVSSAGEWRWSSYRATVGYEPVFPWLCVEVLLSRFGRLRKLACEKYRQFVSDGAGKPSPRESLKNQLFLGSDDFVETMQAMLDPHKSLTEVPVAQKQKKQNLCVYIRTWPEPGMKPWSGPGNLADTR
jgi:putative transposase